MILEGSTSDMDMKRRIDCIKELREMEHLENLDIAQKVKAKRCIEGDENSKFFHGILNRKRRQISIRGILLDGTWVEDPTLVKGAFQEFYNSLFSRPSGVRISTNHSHFRSLSQDQQMFLVAPFSCDEIK